MIPHGTVSGYTNHRCRCRECRTEWAAYHRRYRVSQKAQSERLNKVQEIEAAPAGNRGLTAKTKQES